MTYGEGKAAIAELEKRGWRHIATVLAEDAVEPGNFGMLFWNPKGQKFWLNKLTFRDLPE